jgi:hypothetical protein
MCAPATAFGPRKPTCKLQPSLSKVELFYIFLKLFCKNIRRFENFTLLTTIRRGPQWPPWPTAVSGLTAVAHGSSDVACGPQWAWRSAAVGHGGFRQTAERYGGKSNRRSPRRYGPPNRRGVWRQVPTSLFKLKISPELS